MEKLLLHTRSLYLSGQPSGSGLECRDGSPLSFGALQVQSLQSTSSAPRPTSIRHQHERLRTNCDVSCHSTEGEPCCTADSSLVATISRTGRLTTRLPCQSWGFTSESAQTTGGSSYWDPTYSFPQQQPTWVCQGGGSRPRAPRPWKKQRRGSGLALPSSAQRLLVKLRVLISQDEIYAALDSWAAWDLEFPIVPLKKALRVMEKEQDWALVLAVCRWMVSRGQGRTLGTYASMLRAHDMLGQLEEAERLWQALLREKEQRVPRSLFNATMGMYSRRGLHRKVLEVLDLMEEAEVRPTEPGLSLILDAFEKLGRPDQAEALLAKYPPSRMEIRYGQRRDETGRLAAPAGSRGGDPDPDAALPPDGSEEGDPATGGASRLDPDDSWQPLGGRLLPVRRARVKPVPGIAAWYSDWLGVPQQQPGGGSGERSPGSPTSTPSSTSGAGVGLAGRGGGQEGS